MHRTNMRLRGPRESAKLNNFIAITIASVQQCSKALAECRTLLSNFQNNSLNKQCDNIVAIKDL